MTDKSDPNPEAVIGDLVVALLSVNAWRLEKIFAIYDGLRAQGLLNADAVARMAPEDVFERLEKAGYNRGDFMVGLLAGRLLELSKVLAGEGQNTLRQLVQDRNSEGLKEFLTPVKGIGAAVIRNYMLLLGLFESDVKVSRSPTGGASI